jgi:hypothetical protein
MDVLRSCRRSAGEGIHRRVPSGCVVVCVVVCVCVRQENAAKAAPLLSPLFTLLLLPFSAHLGGVTPIIAITWVEGGKVHTIKTGKLLLMNHRRLVVISSRREVGDQIPLHTSRPLHESRHSDPALCQVALPTPQAICTPGVVASACIHK